jgi:integrase
LIEQVSDLFQRAFFLRGFHAGFRFPGEARGLRWGAVDFASLVIRVYDNWVRNSPDTTKTNDSVAIPMTPVLASTLFALKQFDYRTGESDHVFTLTTLGHPGFRQGASRSLPGILAASGLKAIHMYNARHSFGTALAREGIDVRTIQALMRHAGITTTDQYMAYAPQPNLGARLARALQPETTVAPKRFVDEAGPDALQRLLAILHEEIPAKW